MSTSDEELQDRLSGLDPTVGDGPPSTGSARYASILEQAMSSDTHVSPVAATSDRESSDRRAWRRRGSWRYVAAAAAVAAGIFAFTTFTPGQAPSAEAAVAAAAANTGEATSLRVDYERPNGIDAGSFQGEFSDGNAHLIGVYADGDVQSREFESTIIGNTRYDELDDNGKILTSTMRAEGLEAFAPFAESAQSVITAVLASGGTTAVGTEKVRDMEATRYTTRLDDEGRASLKDLPVGQLQWFGLDLTDSVTRVDVWVAGGLIRKMVVQYDTPGGGDTATTEFYDFGADITISAPGR